MQLLIKVYLVNGEYAKAEKLATDLINDHGLHLMTQSFGTWQPSGCETTWKVTRNVVWDCIVLLTSATQRIRRPSWPSSTLMMRTTSTTT